MELDFIYTDNNYKELGFLRNTTLDIEIGKYGISKNDFELSMNISDWDNEFDKGSLFYYESSEWGGVVDNKKVSTSSQTITFKGYTFRGLLTKEYCQPEEGQSHIVLKGEANTCINTLLGDRFGDLYVVDDIGFSGIQVDYQVRDYNLLEALEKTLKTGNAKLKIAFANSQVHLSAVPINDLSDKITYDNDYQVNMEVETAETRYNHILALGKGELTERTRINLYLQEDGTWGDTELYTGLERKTYKYDNVNAEDEEKLRTEVIEKVEQALKTDKLNISFSADDAELYDIVGAKEKITGISFKEQITQKILKGTIGNLSVSYKVGE